MNTNIYTVYRVTNLINEKVYLGFTSLSLEKRKQSHFNSAKYGKNDCRYFWNAIRKYGASAFKFESIYESLDRKDALDKEAHFIKEYRSQDKSVGYNIRDGGSCGNLSEETKIKISNSMKGRIIPKEERKKMSERMKGYTPSEETKKKMSDNSAQAKHYIITPPDGEEFEIKNLSKFCRENDLHAHRMNDLANNNQQGGKSYKGYRIRKEEYTVRNSKGIPVDIRGILINV